MAGEEKESREMDCCPVIRFSWNAMELIKIFIDFEPINHNFLHTLLLLVVVVLFGFFFFLGGEETKDSLRIPRVYFKRFLPVSNLVGTKKSPLW